MQFGLEDKIIPIYAEAHALPFAENYFDAVISIDSFHYYGAEAEYLDQYLIPLVKDNGIIAISVPGLKKDFFNEVPPELQPFWVENMNMYSAQWWKALWEKSPNITQVECFSQACHELRGMNGFSAAILTLNEM
jgi:cyclopropane fatty-acyl-phospholipid synthase-like methyltransferase